MSAVDRTAALDSPASAKPSDEETAAQIQKLLSSPLFSRSEASGMLLGFLGKWSRDHPGLHVKESELAISVFHRQPATFDSQADSVVRVQMARLRAKIMEYYAAEGATDDVVLDVPKGAYQVVSRYRSHLQDKAAIRVAEPDAAPNITKGSLEDLIIPGGKARFFHRFRLTIGLVAGLILGSSVSMLAVQLALNRTPPHLSQFWTQIVHNGASNLVVFSNPRLAGTLAFDGLHYFQDGVDSKTPSTENLSYTGVGDVQSMFTITHLFDRLKENMKVRAGSVLSWDQAKESNLVFIGRPEQNPALHKLPRLREFYFKFSTGIVNAHRRAGEQLFYGCSARPYSWDHAVIAFIPGLNAGLNTLVLAGNTTFGSQAAAEFVSDDSSVALLLKELGVKPGQKIPYFEALLDVRINNQAPVWSRLIASRLYPADPNSWDPPLSDEQ